MAASVLFACDKDLLRAVQSEIKKQLASLPRASIAQASLSEYGALCQCADLDQACSFINHLAPEHLELACKNPSSLLNKIRHAGAIFLGPFTPEVIGDYTAGPSHTLPTCGAARFSAGITVFSFLKSSSLIEYSEQAMKDDLQPLTQLARAENLEGHARSISSRVKKI